LTEPAAAPLDRLWHLQEVLVEIRLKTERRERTPDHLEHVEAEHRDEVLRGDELRAALAAGDERRRVLASEVVDWAEKRKKYQEQQRLVKNNREYGALLDQIATVAREIRAREDETLALDEETERIKAELAAWEADFAPRQAKYDEQMADWRAEQAQLARQIAVAEGKAEALKKATDRRLLAAFDKIAKARGGLAVAKVVFVANQPNCSGCNIRLRPQLFSDLRLSKEIVHCDGCKRILYFDGIGGT
jgi:predicted  nucleic acid-binding Zn-ribbon protein